MSLTKQEKREQKRRQKQKRINKAARKRKMKSLAIWLISLGLVFGVVGMFIYFSAPEPDLGDYSLDDVGEFEWTKGNESAGVVLVEYSDFECPACGSYYPALKQLAEEFENDMLFVYRHFPLTQIHGNAELAGVAAEAAGEQGMFWEMHDELFERQNEWRGRANAGGLFLSYAEGLGLDAEKFEQDIQNDDLLAKVRNDMRSGTRARVTGTPTFFLNGEKIQNPGNYAEFRQHITDALEQN